MPRSHSTIRLVNGSTGDPVLYVDYPGRDDGFLFDAGDNAALPLERLGDLAAVFITHHHVDHFIGLDRIVRANLDRDKTLRLFGPPGTIRKVYERIRSYEYQFFPFQKIVLDVTELDAGERRSARLECTRRFPEPEVAAEPWTGPVVWETDAFRIEAVFVQHTVPCLAYALVEAAGWQIDPDKLATGLLKPGPWLGEALAALRSAAAMDTLRRVQGGHFRLGDLAAAYFTQSPGSRVAFVTDTAWNDTTRPGLIKLAHRAWRLYCDSFYAGKQSAQAAKHRHMTATAAAELATAAKVEELVLMHFGPRYAGRYESLLAEATQLFPRVSAELGSEQ